MSDDNNDEASSDEGEQIRVTFKLASEVADRSMEVPSDPIAVPASVGRKGLAAVINHLLDRRVVRDDTEENEEDSDEDEDDDKEKLPAIPFDFVLKDNNRLLRSAVEREARRYGLSLEKPLAILYFPAQEAPELQEESKAQPDWISCLSQMTINKQNDSFLCAASYDGSLTVYQPKMQQPDDEQKEGEVVLHQVASAPEAHRGPIKCLATMLDPTSSKNQSILMASGSMDHTLYIHSFDTQSKQLVKQQIQCQHEGYSSAVASLDFSFKSSDNKAILASGDWDGNLALWDLADAEPIPSAKKSKKEGKTSKEASQKLLTPKVLLPQAHFSQISGISWGNVHKTNSSNANTLITGSWDHSIKAWDMERQECVLSLNGSKVVACLDTSHFSEGIVATGHPDCNIRLWDVRVNTNSNNGDTLAVSDKTFRPSHKQWITDVQWSPHNPYHLASTSHDGTVKVWDIRSPIPLHTVRVFPKTEKGLCLAYGHSATETKKEEGADTVSLFLGGSDCVVKHFATNNYS
ncbi:Ribosome biogenesis protein WDR12 [Seminavis robusta]|uniref:Ribosome biogenesis protein WDR12 n=1 Tax=Seminavis robusta TaxID=568900 RepID=A0A9N8HX03_9STRA|nr:Ribosome biogenesis protein WDR12 [Seminavis robusta]|eukprot:Sro2353_g324440.1 Ribosome biogenesis protein WDR12 (520) ;mRNA; f:607-2261